MNDKHKEGQVVLPRCTIDVQKVEMRTTPKNLQLSTQTIIKQSNVHTVQKFYVLGGERSHQQKKASVLFLA